MTMFQAYLLTTLLPNLSWMMHAAFMILIGATLLTMFVSFVIGMTAEDIGDDDGKRLALSCLKQTRWLIPTLVLTLFASAAFPSEKQVAELVGFKMATTQTAQQFYGDAGDFMHAWLKSETKKLADPEEKQPQKADR